MSPKEFTKDEIQRIYLTKTYMLQHLHKKLTVAQLARHAALNKQKFREGFYFVFSYDVNTYLKEARMQTAFILLRHTKRTMKDIASLTGYGIHKANFLTAFRKWYGVSAGSIRGVRPRGVKS